RARSAPGSWRAGATTCCPSRRTNRRSWPTCGRRFPLWDLGPEPVGDEDRTAPPWLARDLARRGGRLDAVTVAEPKARHGRREVRRLWALADPEVKAYAGSSGEHGTPWPHLGQVR